MPITAAEVAEAIKSNPEIQKTAIETLSSSKYAIRDEATETAYQASLRKEGADQATSTIHGQYDKDLAELFGEDYKRNQGEHTYEAMKRIGKAKIQAYTSKVAELEQAIAKGDHSGALKKQLEDLQTSFQKKVEDLTNENNTLKTGVENGSKQSALNAAYGEITKDFVKNLPPMFDFTKKALLDQVLSTVVIKDGVAYKGENGVPAIDTTTFKPVTLVDHLKTIFKDVIDTKKPAGGAGSGGAGGNPPIDPNTITEVNFVRGENVKTPQDLLGQMLEMGIIKGSPVYNKIYAKHVDTKQGKLHPVTA